MKAKQMSRVADFLFSVSCYGMKNVLTKIFLVKNHFWSSLVIQIAVV